MTGLAEMARTRSICRSWPVFTNTWRICVLAVLMLTPAACAYSDRLCPASRAITKRASAGESPNNARRPFSGMAISASGVGEDHQGRGQGRAVPDRHGTERRDQKEQPAAACCSNREHAARARSLAAAGLRCFTDQPFEILAPARVLAAQPALGDR